jgi:hypothetical protein
VVWTTDGGWVFPHLRVSASAIPVGNVIDVWRMCLRVTFPPPPIHCVCSGCCRAAEAHRGPWTGCLGGTHTQQEALQHNRGKLCSTLTNQSVEIRQICYRTASDFQESEVILYAFCTCTVQCKVCACTGNTLSDTLQPAPDSGAALNGATPYGAARPPTPPLFYGAPTRASACLQR